MLIKPHLHNQLQSQCQFLSSLYQANSKARACQKKEQTYPGRVVPELCTSPDKFNSLIPGTDHSWCDGKDCKSGACTTFQHQNDTEELLEDTAENLERKGYSQVQLSSNQSPWISILARFMEEFQTKQAYIQMTEPAKHDSQKSNSKRIPSLIHHSFPSWDVLIPVQQGMVPRCSTFTHMVLSCWALGSAHV